MSFLSDNLFYKIISKTGVNLNSETEQDLGTTKTGKTFVWTKLILHSLSASAASVVITLGQSGTATDFLGAQTLTNLNAAGKIAILQPVPNTTPIVGVEYDGGTTLSLDVTTVQGGAVTATADVFGYYID